MSASCHATDQFLELVTVKPPTTGLRRSFELFNDRTVFIYRHRLSVCRAHRVGCCALRSRPNRAIDRTAARSSSSVIGRNPSPEKSAASRIRDVNATLRAIVEELKYKATSQRVECGRKSDLVNRLTAETRMPKLEVLALQSKVEEPQEAAPPKLAKAWEPCFLPP